MVSATRSTAPEDSSGIRVGGGLSFFASAGLISSSTRSMEKPTHSFLLLTYPNGGDPVRGPIVTVPVSLILSSVLFCWASAGVTPAASSASTITSPITLRMHTLLGCELSVGQDLGQEVLRAVRLGRREEGLRLLHLAHLAVVHEHDAAGHPAGEAHLVGD